MSDQHTQEGQIQRAKRLREQIEGLKAGRQVETPGHEKSLREQIEERAAEGSTNPTRQRDASHEP
jgi:hypothetical protein